MIKKKPAILLALLFIASACRPAANLPTKSSPEYNELVRTFYIGLAALEVGHDVQADAKLAQFTQLAAAEPAGWANWGLLALRQRNYDVAAERLHKARDLAPDNSDIHYLLGLLESGRGNTAPAIEELRKAVELDQNNLIAIYKLAEEVERQGDQKAADEFQTLIQKILAAQPDNLAALVELSRIAAKRGDTETLKTSAAKIVARSSAWPEEVRAQVATLDAGAQAGDTAAAATRTSFLRNVLVRVPEYRRDLAAIKPQPGEEAVPLRHFLRLESPVFKAAHRASVKFTPEPLSTDKVDWVGAIFLGGEGAPMIVTATAREVRLASGVSFPFPGKDFPPTRAGILPIDFNSDFKTDLVFAGVGGVRLFKQESPTAFVDVTGAAKLPPAIVNGNYSGAWAADIEADGDLDIVLGSLNKPAILRNNGDSTFQGMDVFSSISGINDFRWGDLDADGDPDAALLDTAGKLHVFTNGRQGQFTEVAVPADVATPRAIGLAELNDDSVLDLAVVRADGALVRLSDKDHEGLLEEQEVVSALPGAPILLFADLDNNGAQDFVLGNKIYLRGDDPVISGGPGEEPNLQRVFDIADVNGDGLLDILGLDGDGRPVKSVNHCSKNYHWQNVRPRAVQATGDQRINSFGIGGEMEIRSGLLVQKQPITGPLLHFGLGEQPSTDVIRVVWPNGTVRADFEIKADQEIVTEQRLKGSCPFLFAYNGKQMEFVKDAVPWGSAIGLRINTLGTARVEATEEWYKIGRDQLVPHDGYYDLRITAELLETYYYDHLRLMVVDHPIGTDIFVDERFVIPAAKLEITTVSTPRKVARAVDDQGQDVTSIVNTLDGEYLDTFGRGRYQGVTRDHYVELDLGDDVPSTGPLWLIANGWMHPTDSSINVAISQGQQEQAKPLSLEIPDGKGGWQVVRPNMGFPAGRKKVCLFDLSEVFKPGIPHRLRLRTNLEVYWDSLEWAAGVPNAELKTTPLNPELADLHYRGYSVINQKDDSSPEVPDYNRLSSSKQIWRDLIGYYTRFGDVRDLLKQADDRYVIMNAGDEMSFRFAAQPPPAPGWVRDYVIVGDGWIKDGDYNSTFSKTVLPLPYHAKNEYITAPSRLEDEWVYRQHPEDWQNYHTRYVTADVFQNAMRLYRR